MQDIIMTARPTVSSEHCFNSSIFVVTNHANVKIAGGGTFSVPADAGNLLFEEDGEQLAGRYRRRSLAAMV